MNRQATNAVLLALAVLIIILGWYWLGVALR